MVAGDVPVLARHNRMRSQCPAVTVPGSATREVGVLSVDMIDVIGTTRSSRWSSPELSSLRHESGRSSVRCHHSLFQALLLSEQLQGSALGRWGAAASGLANSQTADIENMLLQRS